MDRRQKLSKKKQKLKNEIAARHKAASKNDESKFSASQVLEKAEEYLESFQIELAHNFCEKAVALESNNVKAVELLGLLNLHLGNPAQAYENYTRAVELSPEVGHNKYMSLGQLSCGEESLNNYKKGIEILKKQLVQPSDVEQVKPIDLSNAYLAVAEVYLTDECFDENAEKHCRENLDLAMSTDSNNAEVYHLYASYFISRDDIESAKESIKKGIEMWLPKWKEVNECETQEAEETTYMCPISYSGRVNCSKLLIELEEYETAAEILEYLLDEDDEVVEVWYLLGWLNYLQGGEFRGNIKGYMEKAIELAAKINYQDEAMVEHMKEILQEVSQDMQQDDNMETIDPDNFESSDEEDDADMN